MDVLPRLSGDPFDNSAGFKFPLPEGVTMFPPYDPVAKHLLIAQAHIPPTEMVEVAGFTGTAGSIGPEFDNSMTAKVPSSRLRLTGFAISRFATP